MDQKMLMKFSKWILILGGLLTAYEGATGTNLVQSVFGSFSMYVNIIVFGGAAVYLAYGLLTMKKK